MRYDKHHRRSLRLPNHDYTRGGTYFVTICTAGRECIFGKVTSGKMYLNALGDIVRAEWLRTPAIRPEICLDAFIIMPNHLHGIIKMTGSNPDTLSAGAHIGAPLNRHAPASDITSPYRPRAPHSLGSIIAGFKSAATVRINIARDLPHEPVWQRNYHESIISDLAALARVRVYILKNPAQWPYDRENNDYTDETADGDPLQE